MTFSDYGIVFAGYLCMVIVFFSNSQSNLVLYMQKNTIYNLAIDNAIEAAVQNTVEVQKGNEVVANKEEMVQTFLTCFASNMGVFDSPAEYRLLSQWIPLICVIEQDGFYIYDSITKKFTSKDKWIYREGNACLEFTLSDYVKYTDRENTVLEGYYHDIRESLPQFFYWSENDKNEIKQRVIVDTLAKEMEYAIQQYDEDARKHGIRYKIQFPVIQEEEWYRTIEGTGMFVLFQGHPFGTASVGTYNKMAFGGARRKKHAFPTETFSS